MSCSGSSTLADNRLSALRVADEGFLVASMIERCPKTMMLRELVRNALEAAASAPPGARRVEISAVAIDGIAKLCLWNTGIGLTAAELHLMCDIASSIGKPHGLDGNFGMGAKVAALPSNQHGLRYRSCRDGVVHEVVLARIDGVYGRRMQNGHDVIEATVAARREGRDIALDWTEVVLMGNHETQDTVTDPYAGDPHSPADWLARALRARFFRLPDGITLTLPDGTAFTPTAPAWPGCIRHTAMPGPDGITLHFLHDPAGRAGGVCVVHRDEIYDLRQDGAWMFHAPQFGVSFGAREVAVFIELPDAHPVRADGYRQFLRWRDSHQNHIEVPHFARMVAAHRPDWLLDLIARLAPDARHTDAVRGELATLLRKLRIRRTRPHETVRLLAPDATLTLTHRSPEDDFDAEPPPEIVPLRDLDDIAERSLSGRGGRYYAETHQLFVNLRHLAIDAMHQALVRHFAFHPDQERVRTLATDMAEAALIRRIGRALIHAMAWRAGVDQAAADRFAEWEVEQAMDVPSLSLAAEDYAMSLPAAISAMEATLRTPPRRRRFALPRPPQPGEAVAAAPRRNRALLTLLVLRAAREA